jgi:hypothetical protein
MIKRLNTIILISGLLHPVVAFIGCSKTDTQTTPVQKTKKVSRSESARNFVIGRVSSSMMVPGQVSECHMVPKDENTFTFYGTFVWSQTGGKQRFHGEASGYGDSWRITSIKIQDHSMRLLLLN